MAHGHKPKGVWTMQDENGSYQLALCACGLVERINRLSTELTHNSFHMEWEPIGEWGEPTDEEAEEISLWG